MKSRCFYVAAVVLLSVVLAGPSLAADRALLVGVGDFLDPRISDLPGIELDLEIMTEVAGTLDFAPDHTRVLFDGDANTANVEREIRSWLIDGTGPGDRVLLYISTHGTRVPDISRDESDAADEVLLMRDSRVVRRGDQAPGIEPVLLDDRIDTLIGEMRGREVLVLVDACHSGTVTKGLHLGTETLRTRNLGTQAVVEKFFYYPGMPVAGKDPGLVIGEGADRQSESNYVAISAAQDDEKSLASPQGSYFTLGLLEGVKQASEQGKPLTPKAWSEFAGEYIRSQLEETGHNSRVFHPNLTGGAALAGRPLPIVKSTRGVGRAWERLERIVEASPGRVPVSASQRNFRVGDPLILQVTVPDGGGYLNVVSIDSADRSTVLFPNQFHADNRVVEGRVTIPTEQMKFALPATEPFGPTLVAAFVTRQPVNLFETGFKSAGDVFAEMSPLATHTLDKAVRGFQIESRPADPVEALPTGDASEVYAGKLVAKIVR
ncbi:MAG: caspase family protein [Pseudomonadota bacterium]|nr:caspase family protein [Pseudomonadota bacterium]